MTDLPSILLLQLSLPLATTTSTGAHLSASAPPIPNVILLMADDQGWGDVGFNPHAYRRGTNWTLNPPRTPHLDALATANSSITFWRFYAGSGVCSPTRSAALTGRSPERECIDGAEPHGFGPAWQCLSPMPLSPRTTTIAEVARAAGWTTLHLGKWHLGEFFPKPGDLPHPTYAGRKWPVSNPGQHGFSTWYSTEASCPSTTTNCGCDASWPAGQPGCIVGGGHWKNQSFKCMNYWFPAADAFANASRAAQCRSQTNATLDCVSNMTDKVQGDDSEHILDKFEAFLEQRERRRSSTRSTTATTTAATTTKPFLAVLWLHTIHEPHPALPEWYHNYTDAFGDPAGDYLGTLSQMDAQVGRLRSLLRQYGIANDTMLWYTSDNGPAPMSKGPFPPRDRGINPAMAATNGLRQCKASLYEGGIRTPGIVEWPAAIRQHVDTWHPAYVSDYLPTLLDLLNQSHPNASWAADGMSLLPLIRSLGAGASASAALGVRNDTSRRPSSHPLVFKFGGQEALIDNEWKVLRSALAGHCPAQAGSVIGKSRTLMFNLEDDPTESMDLSNSSDPAHAEQYRNLTARLDAFVASVAESRVLESQCAAPKIGDAEGVGHSHSLGGKLGSTGIVPACQGPFPEPPSPQPVAGPFVLRSPTGECVAAAAAFERATVNLVSVCNVSNPLQQWQATSADKVFLDGGGQGTQLCLKPVRNDCDAQDSGFLLGENCSNPHGVRFVAVNDTDTDTVVTTGVLELVLQCSVRLCVSHSAANGTLLSVQPCTDHTTAGWARLDAGRA